MYQRTRSCKYSLAYSRAETQFLSLSPAERSSCVTEPAQLSEPHRLHPVMWLLISTPNSDEPWPWEGAIKWHGHNWPFPSFVDRADGCSPPRGRLRLRRPFQYSLRTSPLTANPAVEHRLGSDMSTSPQVHGESTACAITCVISLVVITACWKCQVGMMIMRYSFSQR